MKNYYLRFICALCLLFILIKPVLALIPYKIEVKELPIQSYDISSRESKPSIYGDYITYKSNFSEITIYNIKTGNKRIITKEPIKVTNIQLYENNVLYIAYYRNYKELTNYNILTNKTFAVIPVGDNPQYYLTDNKIISFVDCQAYDKTFDINANYSYCIREVIKSSIYGKEVVIFDINTQYDFPPSLQVTKCNLGENNIKKLDGFYFKRNIYPQNPKEKEKCVSCNILTGESVTVPLDECSERKQTKCGIGTAAFDDFWEVDLQSNPQKLCYSNNNMNYTLTYSMRGISTGDFTNIDGFKDKVVFFSFDGKGHLGQVASGDIKKICESFSNSKIDKISKIEYNCNLNEEKSCNCNFYGFDNLFNKSYSASVDFNIINNDENNTEKNILQSKIKEIKNALESKNNEQFKLIEEQTNEKIKKRILSAFIIILIILGFVIRDYYKTRILLKKRQKINAGVFIWRKHLLEQERKRILEAERINRQFEKEKLEEEKLKKEVEKKRQRELRKKRLEEDKKAKEAEEFRKTQKSKGLVEYQSKWETPEQVKKWKEIEYGIDRNFMNFSHFGFEEFIAKLFRKMGYTTQLTPKTGDYGVDIIAKDKNDIIAVQAKQFKHGNNISNVIVQQVLGAMWKVKANKAIIITTSDFTMQAKVQAKEAPVELWNLQTLKNMVRKYFIEETKIKQ